MTELNYVKLDEYIRYCIVEKCIKLEEENTRLRQLIKQKDNYTEYLKEEDKLSKAVMSSKPEECCKKDD